MSKRFGRILFMLLLLCGSASGQTFVFEVGGGLASHYGSSRSIGAFRIGAGCELALNEQWSVTPSLVYYAKGWKDKNQEVLVYDDKGNVQLDENGNEIKGVMNVTSNTNYVELPIVMNYRLSMGNAQAVILSAGPYVAYGVGGKAKTYGDTKQTGAARYYYAHSTFSQDNMHRFDAGVTAGGSYAFSEQFSAGICADFGLANVNTTGSKNLSVVVSLAYRF
jgi:hypothetical protein